MIKGLDDDEIEYLDLVDRTKLAVEQKKNLEEERELTEYRNRVATLQERSLEQRLQAEISAGKPRPTVGPRHSQQKLLRGAVVTRKHKLSENETRPELANSQHADDGKRKRTEENAEEVHVDEINADESCTDAKQEAKEEVDGKRKRDEADSDQLQQGALTCVGILPGLGCYNDSSDSELSSDSEQEAQAQIRIDMLGRKIIKKKQDEDN